ncbi:uncharacterized protein K460DRAFT_322426, partial [Cucurbitaria berberidis CBS 394.84]
MNSTSSPTAPPPYEAEGIDLQWRIRNAKYRSAFATNGRPGVEDYRAHIECMKDSFLEFSHGVGSPAEYQCLDAPQVIDVQYSQAFSNIERLICEYQESLRKIKPLHEEDVLFLLLGRFSQSSGASVYMEVRRPGDVQVYDSTISEPSYTAAMQEHLVHASGVINAEYSLPPAREPSQIDSPRGNPLEQTYYVPIPQTPSDTEIECSVTMNFPEMVHSNPHQPEYTDPSDTPPMYMDVHNNLVAPTNDWAVLPEKLQPPVFRVHRCHHRCVERGGEDDAFELPFGFPEVVHHIYEAPENFYHTGFYVHNLFGHSLPYTDGGVQAFECHILPNETRVFITIERKGDMLVYNCFRDEEVSHADTLDYGTNTISRSGSRA